MAKDDVIILNEGLEQRTSKTGKVRFTVRISAEPLRFDLSPKELGRPIAMGVAHHLREQVKNIAATASPATIKYREKAAKAFAEGKSWAMKRYAGGRTGPKPPNQSDRLFNDSGRFADTIRASASKDGAWRVNVAANRLSGDPTMVQRIWGRLVQLVPEFQDMAKLVASNDVVRGMMEAQRRMITKGKMTSSQATVWDVVEALIDTFDNVADLGGD